ncbi:MAG TPA: phosphoribosyltransferase [Candidatus Woesebacteria bacterium]|nr:phosphoribosyltransferase [Candidatus Woesebacteria bacterium]
MTFQEINFKGDRAKYITPSWDQLDDLTLQVAQQVINFAMHFDLIVALAKGAWPMSRSFVDYTGVKELASLGIKFYSGINKRLAQPEVYQQIPTTVKGKNVLIFDDVADTGESLNFTRSYLQRQGVSEVKTATLFIKPWSTVIPDFYGIRTDAWIIFPFEKREMRDLLSNSWQKQGADQKEIAKRLKQMSLSQEVLDL